MRASRKRPEEDEASAVVAAAMGVSVKPHDVGGLQSAYDFAIDPHGDPQALEVVRCLDPTVVKNGEAAGRYTGGGLRLSGLRKTWLILLTDDRAPAYSQLAGRLRAPLQTAKAAGLTSVADHEQWSLDRPAAQQVAARLAGLRIRYAMSIDPRSPEGKGLIQLATMTGGGASLGSDAVLTELEDYLHGGDLADVRNKLASSQLARRHAFVWIDMSGAFASWRFFGRDDEFELPSRPPRLPPEVTDVWWTTGHRGWRWSSDGWSELEPWRLLGSSDS